VFERNTQRGREKTLERFSRGSWVKRKGRPFQGEKTENGGYSKGRLEIGALRGKKNKGQ